MDRLPALLKMLEAGRDSAMLRFGIGNEYFGRDDWTNAAAAFAEAVRQDPTMSAAWKLYGRALMLGGEAERAAEVLEQGLEAAAAGGDKQAEKQMQVYLKRIRKGELR